jgi:hypothetical protein
VHSCGLYACTTQTTPVHPVLSAINTTISVREEEILSSTTDEFYCMQAGCHFQSTFLGEIKSSDNGVPDSVPPRPE